jgi:hypothetical protein
VRSSQHNTFSLCALKPKPWYTHTHTQTHIQRLPLGRDARIVVVARGAQAAPPYSLINSFTLTHTHTHTLCRLYERRTVVVARGAQAVHFDGKVGGNVVIIIKAPADTTARVECVVLQVKHDSLHPERLRRVIVG